MVLRRALQVHEAQLPLLPQHSWRPELVPISGAELSAGVIGYFAYTAMMMMPPELCLADYRQVLLGSMRGRVVVEFASGGRQR